MSEWRHQVASALQAIQNSMHLGKHGAVDRMDQRVAFACLWIHVKRSRENRVARGCKGDFHRIIHAAAHDRINAGAIRTAAEHMRRRVRNRREAGAFVGLFCESAFAPVNPAIGTEVRTVNIVGATAQRLALKPFAAAIGNTVAVRIFELPDGRRRAAIDSAVEPKKTFGKHHMIGENDALVEPAIAMTVLETKDAVGFLLKLFFDLVIAPGGVSYVKAATVIEVGRDWPVYERRARDFLERKALRQ